MMMQEVDWDTFCGQLDIRHLRFDVTVRGMFGRVEDAVPRLKNLADGGFQQVIEWYSRHRNITFRATPIAPHGTLITNHRVAEGRSSRVDRSKWRRGPWDQEPDLLVWNYYNYPCVMARNGVGAWCGYVGVPKGHAGYGTEYDELIGVRVHRGVTFAGFRPNLVFHAYEEIGEKPPSNTWWVGFDCAHPGDAVPSIYMSALLDLPGDQYMTVYDARANVLRMAEQFPLNNLRLVSNDD